MNKTTAQRFQYTVTTKTHKTLTGFISADSLSQANTNLTQLGYTVLAVVPAPELVRGGEKKVFSFEAYNKDGKKILGTISTTSIDRAQKKLEQDHNLTIVQLQEMYTRDDEQEEKKKVFFSEATMVLEKAEHLLQEISPYDTDYNKIFDATEDLRYVVKMKDVQSIESKMMHLLQVLQEKEKTVIVEEKKKTEDTIVRHTNDLMMSIKVETEESVKHMPTFYLNAVLEELRILSGWLLAFYGVYFVLAEMVWTKNFSFSGSLFLINTILSPLLYKITLSVLFLHLYCHVKLRWLFHKNLTALLVFVVVLLLILWTFLI